MEEGHSAEKLNVWAIVGCLGLGVAFVGLALFRSSEDTVNAVLVDVGVSVALVGVLFLVERSFVRRVRVGLRADTESIAERAATSAAEQVEDRIQRQIDERLADLDEATKAKRDQRREAEAASIVRLVDSLTYEQLVDALEKANDRNDFSEGIVRFTDPVGDAHAEIEVSWGWRPQGALVPDRPSLMVQARFDDRVVSVIWAEDQAASDVGVQLDDALVAEGLYSFGSGTLNWQAVMEELVRVLEIGRAARRHDTNDWSLEGEPIVKVVGDLAVTNRGVVSKGRGLAVTTEAIFAPNSVLSPQSGESNRTWTDALTAHRRYVTPPGPARRPLRPAFAPPEFTAKGSDNSFPAELLDWAEPF